MTDQKLTGYTYWNSEQGAYAYRRVAKLTLREKIALFIAPSLQVPSVEETVDGDYNDQRMEMAWASLTEDDPE